MGAGYAPSPRPPRGLPHDVPGRTPRNVGRRMGGEGAPGAAARSGDARSRRWRSGPALVGSRSIPGADHLSVAVSRWHRVARILRSSGTGRYGLSFPGRPHPPSHRSAHGFAGRAVSGMTGRRRRGSWQGMRLCAASHRPPSVDRRGPHQPHPRNRAGRSTPEVDEMAQPEPCRGRTKRPPSPSGGQVAGMAG